MKYLTFKQFLRGMKAGYSGHGSTGENTFTIIRFNGKECKPFTISYSTYVAYQSYLASKETLEVYFNAN